MAADYAEDMADPTLLHVVCLNRSCAHYNRIRTVRMLHLGAGVYARIPLVCECSPKVALTSADTRAMLYSLADDSV